MFYALSLIAAGTMDKDPGFAKEKEAGAILNQILAIEPDHPGVAHYLIHSFDYAATAIPARFALERRQWKEAASLELQDNVRQLAPLDRFKWGEAHIHFARAVGAAHSGSAAAARAEVAKLNAIEQALTIPPGSYDWRTQVTIERQ